MAKLPLGLNVAVPFAYRENAEPKASTRRTRWFSGRKWQPAPEQIGAWELRHPTDKRYVYAWWTGGNWCPYAATTDQALWYKENFSQTRDLYFRGWTVAQNILD